MDDSPNTQKTRICFFPFPAHGHTIPMADTAKLLTRQGARATIITTSTKEEEEPNLGPDIRMTKGRLPVFVTQETEMSKFREEVAKAEVRACGVLVNSFYELEPRYADHFRDVLGRKIWHIGPVSLSNRRIASEHEHACLKWLDSKGPSSVVYVCFGTTVSFTSSALVEIAIGLENSGLDFVWVVRRSKNGSEDSLPEGFEERTKGRGLVIRGWAPQVLILEHKAVGGFVTHCGWNSTSEAICAGVPMVTWPVASEQFYNEKLVVDVLKIGSPVGARRWGRLVGDDVKSEALEKALARVMVGEEAAEMRKRARELAGLGRKAVEEGGSSHRDLGAFLEEFSTKDV